MAAMRWLAVAAVFAVLIAGAAGRPDREPTIPLRRGLKAARASVSAAAPVAPRRPRQLMAVANNGDVRLDDYYWLRDDTRKNPDVLKYLNAENKYTTAALEDTKPLQDTLYKEMRGRIQEDDRSVPYRDRGYWYYARISKGTQYEVHCRRKARPDEGPLTETSNPDMSYGEEEILLDENKRKTEGGHAFYSVDSLEESPDQKLLAWTEDVLGGEKYDLHVKDIASGKELTLPIRSTSGDIMWANDNATLFYVRKDKLDRPYKVMRHSLNDPLDEDQTVYIERDPAFYVSIGRSADDTTLFIRISSAVTSEVRYLSADDPTGEFKVVYPRVNNVQYGVGHHPGPKPGEGWFLISMRDQQRPNEELWVAPESDPTKHTVLLPHRTKVQIEGASAGAKYIVVNERSNASTRVVIHPLPAGGAMPSQPLGAGRVITFDREAVYDISGGLSGDYSSAEVLRLGYNSLTTPASVIDYYIPNGRTATKKVAPVLGGFKSSDYSSERLWATAPDGVKVPISLVYRKQLFKKDGSAKMLLYGYGSYGMSSDPTFDAKRLSLLDRGWVYAIAHIRGGGDLGRLWYEDGKYLKKKNTFTDFIACAEHLVNLKYTSPSNLAIEGRSAGGLLMGATLNMRPDLFNAAIAGVPFVDVLTTMSDSSIPLTTIEYEEWGNPSNPKYYDYIKSYSPVDNVKGQRYPNMLVTAGLFDPRVGYWEPAKWVARLRAAKKDDNLLLLKTEMGAGHFSITGRFDRLKERAMEYAFLLKASGQMDVAPLAPSGSNNAHNTNSGGGGGGATASAGGTAVALAKGA